MFSSNILVHALHHKFYVCRSHDWFITIFATRKMILLTAFTILYSSPDYSSHDIVCCAVFTSVVGTYDKIQGFTEGFNNDNHITHIACLASTIISFSLWKKQLPTYG